MKRARQILLLGVLGCVFLAGVIQLFLLRFEHGDVYPAYSSLRADPLGAMVLYESLERVPGMEVKRDYSARNQLPEGPLTAYLHLAAQSDQWNRVDKDLLDEIERFVVRGGRLVIAFYPEGEKPYNPWARDPGRKDSRKKASKKQKEKAKDHPPTIQKPPLGDKPPPKKPQGDIDEESDPTEMEPDKNDASEGKEKKPGKGSSEMLQERWGIQLVHVALKKADSGYIPEDAENVSSLRLPDYLEWHSGIVVTNASSRWNTIYARQGNPVVVERKWGAGSIVVMTDSYPLSNESLGKERHSELLAWLISPTKTVFFDEAHLGVAEQLGVSSLMLKYRLYWVAASLFLLAGLYIWRSSAKFVPPLPPELPPGYVAGKDSSAGFLNLLRRNIPAKDILKLCFEEWKKSVPTGNPHWKWRVERVSELMEQAGTDGRGGARIVETYKQICGVLKARTPLQAEPAGHNRDNAADRKQEPTTHSDL